MTVGRAVNSSLSPLPGKQYYHKGEIMEIVITFAAAIFVAIVLMLLAYWSCRALRTSTKGSPEDTKNFPQDALRHLSPQARTIIAEIAKSLRGLPYEAEYIIDQDGETLFNQTQYNAKSVEFSDEQIAYMVAHPGSISIHNHNTDTPPSVTDLSFAARTRQNCFIVVSPNYTYIVEPPASGWKGDDELEAFCKKHMRLFNIINRTERFAGFDRDGAILMLSEVEYETTDEAMAAIVAKLGYHYVRIAKL